MANEVAENKPTKMGITSYLTNPKVKANVTTVVGEKKTQAFISSIVSAVQTNKLLAECTNASILNAALLGESLELPHSPQMGCYYMVPYKDRKTGISEATFQLGTSGYKQLAMRSGQYRKIIASAIKKGELKSYNPITEEFEFNPILDPAIRAHTETIGYYAMFELVNGFKKEIYWPVEAMEAHASKYSQTYKADKRYNTNKSIWSTNFDAMAEKTMIRTLIRKWGIMSIDMQKAVVADMGVVQDDGSISYVDNQPDVVEEAHEAVAGANADELVIDADVVDIPSEDEVNQDNPFAG